MDRQQKAGLKPIREGKEDVLDATLRALKKHKKRNWDENQKG